MPSAPVWTHGLTGVYIPGVTLINLGSLWFRNATHMALVLEILIAASPASKMLPQTTVRAVPGKGLEGDRYFFGTGTFSPLPQKPDFEITLIEQEKITAFAAQAGVAFTGSEARRNIVTEGVSLNDLVGREFYLGQVRIRGMRLCEPCNHLARISFPESLQGLVHKGGLRGQILCAGQISVGDEIKICGAPGEVG